MEWEVFKAAVNTTSFTRGPLMAALYLYHNRTVVVQAFVDTIEIVDHTITFPTTMADGASELIAEIIAQWPAWWDQNMARFGELIAQAETTFMERNL